MVEKLLFICYPLKIITIKGIHAGSLKKKIYEQFLEKPFLS